MPTPANIRLQATVNAGAPQLGAVTCALSDSVVLSLQSNSGVTKCLYELYEFPAAFPQPSGWSTNAGGTYYYLSTGGPAPAIAMSATLWGKYLTRATVNDGLRNGKSAIDLIDAATALQIISVNGVLDVGFGETNQFDGQRFYVGALKTALRLLDSVITSGGGGGGGTTFAAVKTALQAATSSVGLNGFKWTNLLDGTADTDSATTGQVNRAGNRRAKCRTTGPLPANTYANGTGGVAATLTGNSNGALANQDGQVMTVSDVLFVNDEATQSHNGIFTITQIGDGSHPYILTRSTDSDTAAKLSGCLVWVASGTLYGKRLWGLPLLTSGITVGTTALFWGPADGLADFVKSFETTTATTTVVFSIPLADNTKYRLRFVHHARDATVNIATWDTFTEWYRATGSNATFLDEMGPAPVNPGPIASLIGVWATVTPSTTSVVDSVVTSTTGHTNFVVEAHIQAIPLAAAP
jgi:hypothetical protein